MPYPRKSAEARAYAVARHKRVKWSRVRFRDNRVEETKSTHMGAFDCWCGEESGHDWPGSADGALHPGPEAPMVPPKVAKRELQIALQAAGVCPECRGYPPFLTGNLRGRKWPWCPVCQGMGTFPPPNSAHVARWRKEVLDYEQEQRRKADETDGRSP